MTDGNKGQDTRIVQGGRRKEWTSSIVNPPVYRASTILFENVAALRAAKPEQGTFYYGRQGTPTSWALAEALTELEPGAAGTRLFPSGVAAIATALMTVLRPGDELLMVDSAYEPTRIFCDTVLKRMGVATRYYDPMIGTGIEALIGDATRAIFLESPGSLTFEVQDVPGICAIAAARGIASLLDNTWATSYFFPAIAAGVDLSITACTKYIVGHSDVMLGSVTANERLWPRLVQTSRAFGQCASMRRAGSRWRAGWPSSRRWRRSCTPPSRTVPVMIIGGVTSGARRASSPSSWTVATTRPGRASSTALRISASATAGEDMRAWPCRWTRSGAAAFPSLSGRGGWCVSTSGSRIPTT